MIFNFKKNRLDSNRIYSVQPSNISQRFIYLLHILTDEDIYLTFNERDLLYEYIESIIKLLEEKKQSDNLH